MIKRLKNRRGETIAETLVSLTIAAVGLVLLASMINVSTRMIETSRESVKKYMARENRIAEQPTDETGAETLSNAQGTVKVYYKEEGVDEGPLIILRDAAEGESEPTGEISVEYYVNSEARGDEVKAYEVVSYKTSEEATLTEGEDDGGEEIIGEVIEEEGGGDIE